MSTEEQLYTAAVSLTPLREIDSRFRNHLKTVDTNIKDLGSLIVRDSEISATCLGVRLKAVGRPVAVDGNLALVEYVFEEEHESERKVSGI